MSDDLARAPARGPAKPSIPLPSARYQRYAMVLLLFTTILNFVDRQIINILAEPIKQELHLADWQIGMMSGLAFAVLYTFLGIPIARLAERRSRPAIIAISISVWSAFTVLCGTATSYIQLLLFRIGVGVGEAGGTPPGHSLISDLVPREKRASALAFVSSGTSLGTLVGMIMGGYIASIYGWRAAFWVAGVPGIIFAVLVALTLREPRHKLPPEQRRSLAPQTTFSETLRFLATKRTFWLISFGAAAKSFIAYGQSPFTASFFLRVHGDEIAKLAAWFGLQPIAFLGIALGLIIGIGGAISANVGGWIADYFQARHARIRDPSGHRVLDPHSILYRGDADADSDWRTRLVFVSFLLTGLWYGPIFATGQSVVPAHMRATASAILIFIMNLIGLGLGRCWSASFPTPLPLPRIWARPRVCDGRWFARPGWGSPPFPVLDRTSNNCARPRRLAIVADAQRDAWLSVGRALRASIRGPVVGARFALAAASRGPDRDRKRGVVLDLLERHA